MTRRLFRGAVSALALLCLTCSAPSVAAQTPAGATPPRTLTVAGDVAKPITLTPVEFKTLPRTRVGVKEDGKMTAYEGVLVGELLKRAGSPLGSDLRGNAIASYVIASAADGYQVVFSLAELDPGFTSNDIIVADAVDGRPLPDQQGPFRIVAPKDARASRFIRMLERIELVRLRKGAP